MAIDLLRMVTNEEFNTGLRNAVIFIVDMLKSRKETAFYPGLITHEVYYDELDDEIKERVAYHVIADMDMAEKRKILRAIGYAKGKERSPALMVFFMSEAWLSHQEQAPDGRQMMPSEDPKREECVVVAGMTADGRASMAQQVVTRGRGHVMIPGELHIYEHGAPGTEAQNPLLAEFYVGMARGLQASFGVKTRGKR